MAGHHHHQVKFFDKDDVLSPASLGRSGKIGSIAHFEIGTPPVIAITLFADILSPTENVIVTSKYDTAQGFLKIGLGYQVFAFPLPLVANQLPPLDHVTRGHAGAPSRLGDTAWRNTPFVVSNSQFVKQFFF